MTFEPFPKIPRRGKVFMRITEKIDGTNCQINIPEEPDAPWVVGSRNRVITPGQSTDNFGFAGWVEANKEMLSRLGPGRHYGEWWGPGIGPRKYPVAEKRLSLFNVGRYQKDGLPEGVPATLVPVLYSGAPDMNSLEHVLEKLRTEGSVLCPGFMNPEGAVVTLGDQIWKEILDKQGPSPEEK